MALVSFFLSDSLNKTTYLTFLSVHDLYVRGILIIQKNEVTSFKKKKMSLEEEISDYFT